MNTETDELEHPAGEPGCTCHGRDIWTRGVPCRQTCEGAQLLAQQESQATSTPSQT